MSVKLTDEQKQIVEAPMGAALVTAGAGSGKTRVLTQRIAYLQSLGITADKIFALTFTNKAAREMKQRVDKLLGFSFDVFAGTFHSFCARFLFKNIDKLDGYSKDFSIYDVKDTEKAIKEVLTQNAFPDLGKDDVKKVGFYISQIKNDNGKPEDYCSGDILRAVKAYNELLKRNNALDFDDLLLKTLELFDKCPEVLTAMQNRSQYILVDEFQDTNIVQYEIVKRLAALHKNIMVVGDEDQCIYTWRGASIDNFKRFQKDFDVKIYKLEENFRSSNSIVTLAGKLVEHNQNRIVKNLFSKLPGIQIGFERFDFAREEARFIVNSIKNRVICGDAKYRDFAIMVRTNATSRLFEEQLRDNSIPYAVWGGFKFYDRAEIKLVLSYLRVLLNPMDEVALLDVLNFPRRGIGDSSIEKIKEFSSGSSCFEVIRDIEKYAENFTKKTLSGIKNFRDVYNRLSTIHDEFGFLALADHFIGEIGLDKEYSNTKFEQDRDRLENLYQLVADIKEKIMQTPNLSLSMYLKSATLATDTEAPEIDDRVIITTVHSAKGLEFDNVFVVGLENGLFPIKRAFDRAADIEEERRLLYVALTRAKHGLHLSYCRTRQMFGKSGDPFPEEAAPSMFLKEMGFEFFTDPEPRTDNFQSRHEHFREHKKNFHHTAVHKSTEHVFAAKSDTAESLGFENGDKVRHEKFGQGIIQQVIDKNILKINFDSAGIKMLSLAYARLEKL